LMFMVVVIFFTLALGYGLSLLEHKAASQMSDASRDLLHEEAPKANNEGFATAYSGRYRTVGHRHIYIIYVARPTAIRLRSGCVRKVL
jgi:hypothetical protein